MFLLYWIVAAGIIKKADYHFNKLTVCEGSRKRNRYSINRFPGANKTNGNVAVNCNKAIEVLKSARLQEV